MTADASHADGVPPFPTKLTHENGVIGASVVGTGALTMQSFHDGHYPVASGTPVQVIAKYIIELQTKVLHCLKPYICNILQGI